MFSKSTVNSFNHSQIIQNIQSLRAFHWGSETRPHIDPKSIWKTQSVVGLILRLRPFPMQGTEGVQAFFGMKTKCWTHISENEAVKHNSKNTARGRNRLARRNAPDLFFRNKRKAVGIFEHSNLHPHLWQTKAGPDSPDVIHPICSSKTLDTQAIVEMKDNMESKSWKRNSDTNILNT